MQNSAEIHEEPSTTDKIRSSPRGSHYPPTDLSKKDCPTVGGQHLLMGRQLPLSYQRRKQVMSAQSLRLLQKSSMKADSVMIIDLGGNPNPLQMRNHSPRLGNSQRCKPSCRDLRFRGYRITERKNIDKDESQGCADIQEVSFILQSRARLGRLNRCPLHA